MASTPHRDRVRVFISHQWTDKQIADRLGRDLEPFAEVWMDYRNLRPGDAIQPTIDEALVRTDVVLVLWTGNAARSNGVRAEIETSRRLGLRVIPCLFEYDSGGDPQPPLPDTLRNLLGVDFHHYGSGLAQIADFIVDLQADRLPAEARLGDHPGRRMIDYLRGYLSYLANYRKLRDVPDERALWIDRIIEEIERFVRAGGDRDAVRGLVEAARRSDVDDPEGIGELIRRLEPILAEPAGAVVRSSGTGSTDDPTEATAADPGPDLVVQRLTAVVDPDEVSAAAARIDRYLANAPPALAALRAYAHAAGSHAGVQVVDYLEQYLHHADDLIPDDLGRYGRLDDAWLILNTAFRLVEAGLVPVAAVPIDWDTVLGSDFLVRVVMPPAVLDSLSATVFQMLNVIQSEVAAYRPWFTPNGTGYSPMIAEPADAGGTWEDQMNRALLGTGLSVDG